MKNSVTITMIFEASALNRDEGAGGNIITIKKLTRADGRVYSFISRPAIRHYLFTTLHKMDPKRWKPTPVRITTGNKKVVQLRVLNDDGTKVEHTIIDSAELDVFGYMVTIGKENNDKGGNLTRKTSLGITKAISLEPWQGDMAMYANHDLVERGIKQGKDATPDPYNREEHNSHYKVSFTLDLERLGVDEWYGNKDKLEKLLSEYKFGSDKGKIEDLEDKNGEVIGKKIKVDVEEAKGRVKDVLEAIKNGLIYHSSGENEIIKPKFLVAALVKIPAPVFHPFVEAKKIAPLTLNSDLLKDGLKDGWIIKENGKPIVYLYIAPGVEIEPEETGLQWEDFLRKVLNEI